MVNQNMTIATDERGDCARMSPGMCGIHCRLTRGPKYHAIRFVVMHVCASRYRALCTLLARCVYCSMLRKINGEGFLRCYFGVCNTLNLVTNHVVSE